VSANATKNVSTQALLVGRLPVLALNCRESVLDEGPNPRVLVVLPQQSVYQDLERDSVRAGKVSLVADAEVSDARDIHQDGIRNRQPRVSRQEPPGYETIPVGTDGFSLHSASRCRFKAAVPGKPAAVLKASQPERRKV